MGREEIVIMFMSGPDDGRVVRLHRRQGHGRVSTDGVWSVKFGRREDCDILIPFDTQVSREHARLRVTPDDTLWLDDAGSLNGTFLSKERVTTPVQVEAGQLFRLGRTWFRVQQTDMGGGMT